MKVQKMQDRKAADRKESFLKEANALADWLNYVTQKHKTNEDGRVKCYVECLLQRS